MFVAKKVGNISKIGITYNLKEKNSFIGIVDSEYMEEFDTPQTIETICEVLKKHGFETVKLGGNIDIIEKLQKENIDFVFNIAEGYYGRNRESHIPAVVEMLGIPYSGSDPLTLALTLDKIMTKKIIPQIGIPIPNYIVVKAIEDLMEADKQLRYPLITKPAWEGSSKGIYRTSKVSNRESLEQSVLFLLGKYPGQPIIIEEYIEGREITIAVIGNDNPSVLGIMEITNKSGQEKDFLYSLETKRNWRQEAEYIVPAQISELLEGHLRNYAITAFKEFGCRDIARIDFRVSGTTEAYLLELNPLPGLSPEYSDLVIMADKAGISYEGLILLILSSAFLRYGFIQESQKLIEGGVKYEAV